MRRKLCLLLVSLLLAAWLTVGAAAESARSDMDIIHEMIVRHDEPETVSAMLDMLRGRDADKAERWQRVMDYWRYANSVMPVRFDELPEDLAFEGRLCIIVLGYQLEYDGSMRQELIGRLQVARHCAEQYPEAYVLCTGGGTAMYAPEVTEAGSMADWLIAQSVAPERIIVEDRSMSTDQNVLFSEALLRERYPDVGAVVIVSSDYHIPWSASLFQAQFILNGDERLSVIANAAYRTEQNEDYMEYQTAQLLRLAEAAESEQ